MAGLRIRGAVVLLQRAGGGGWLSGVHCYGNKLESTGVHDTQHTLKQRTLQVAACPRVTQMRACVHDELLGSGVGAYFGQNRFLKHNAGSVVRRHPFQVSTLLSSSFVGIITRHHQAEGRGAAGFLLNFLLVF